MFDENVNCVIVSQPIGDNMCIYGSLRECKCFKNTYIFLYAQNTE